MLDEYALIPDVFDPQSYSDPAFIEMCLRHLKEPILQEALVRNLADGEWSSFYKANSGTWHRLAMEILSKLAINNRLRSFPRQAATVPTTASEWCNEALASGKIAALTGIISAHITKQQFSHPAVASIERLTGTNWWQCRSSSVSVDRKTAQYLQVLDRVLIQCRSLMFIDPNLDPSAPNYREFVDLLLPLAKREIPPKIEIHRSLCKGDGRERTFPSKSEWATSFEVLGAALNKVGLPAQIFFWDDFHDRFLITDLIGIIVPYGFDVTRRQSDLTIWGRLGRAEKEIVQKKYDPAASSQSFRFQFNIGT